MAGWIEAQVKVYRVQHQRSHVVPYNHTVSRVSEKILYEALERAELLPTPEEDGICVGMQPEMMSGFATIRCMHKWFGHTLFDLFKAGFVIAEYRVATDSVWCGGHQVVFDSRCSERIGEVSINRFAKCFKL